MRHLRGVADRLIPAGFELLIVLLLFIEAIQFVTGAPKPGSVTATYPGWIRDLWGWILLAGTILAAAGLSAGWRRTHAAGMWAIAWVALFYAVAVFAHAEPGGWLQGTIDLALCLVAGMRAVQLQRHP